MCQKAEKCHVLETPPLWSTVRFDTMKIDGMEAKFCMEKILQEQSLTRACSDSPKLKVELHPVLPDLLLIKGVGPRDVRPVRKEIYVDQSCGCAVMRGADIYAPGILGSNEHFNKGDVVSVYADLECVVLRGWKKPFDGKRVFLGNGAASVSRNDVFLPSENGKLQKVLSGVGIAMNDPVWLHPKFDSAVIEDWGFSQNLPSVVCGHVLDPQPNELVLDMCAAPGGKSTHLATLMKDQGRVVCIDTNANRLKQLEKNAKALSVKSIEAYRADAVDLLASENSVANERRLSTFPPETFDRILLDAPCSGSGQRPSFKKVDEVLAACHVPVQRKLLKTACKLLKKGGTLVYSTCSVQECENETQIVWLLDTFSDMHLDAQHPFLGTQSTISQNNAAYAQRFDPRKSCSCTNEIYHDVRPNCLTSDLSPNGDTIGFFIAKLVKR